MKKLVFVLCCVTGLLGTPSARAFVMIGPMDVAEVSSGGIDFNYTDDLGGPKDLKTFFRWNTPMLTYAFDASFMQYFGLEGREAVKEAFTIVNDFFENDDYSGVSALDYTKHGFRSNYNTTWENRTAKEAGIIDLKSLVLGMVVNQLGLGNPHRYAFGARAITTNAAGTQLNFNVRLRNFDPITFKPTSVINGVTYSYRLIHDAPPSAGFTVAPTFADMEEFTTDTSGNAWTSVAGIVDAFYGNTAIYWTDQPTLFGFGMFYSGKSAMGGQYEPRHALTYDDAGGLHYLYRKGNIVYENLDPNVALIIPANFLPTYAIPVFPNGSPRQYPDPSGTTGAFIPRRNSGIIPGLPITSSLPAQAPPALVDVALRGGMDKMKFIEQPFDSFLGITFSATNHIWTDRFVSTNGQNVGNLNNTIPGTSAYIGIPTLKWFEQTVGRGIFQPDIIFVADELGVSPDGVPIAFNRTDSLAWIDNYTNNLGPVQLLTTNVGPGLIVGPMQYTFTKLGEGFEVIWSGEASMVGNTDSYSLWGHIKGPGPNDVVIFPNDAQMHILENVLTPATAAPTITRIYDSGQDKILTRTEEALIIEGQLLNSVEHIQIMNDNLVVQTISGSQVQTFIKSHQQIVIPEGVINELAEGAADTRTVRVWNTLGASTASPNKIGIYTGLPVITGTSKDDLTYDRTQSLTIYGYGFKSGQVFALDGNASLTHVRVEDASDNMVFPAEGNSTEVTFDIISDNQAVLPLNFISSAIADGKGRRIRVARSGGSHQLSKYNQASVTSSALYNQLNAAKAPWWGNYINYITTKPVITALSWDSSSNFRRDEAIDINGTALNTAYRIELVNTDGSSLSPAMFVNLPNSGVKVDDDNGTSIQLSRDVFYTTQADGNATKKQFKVFNVVGNTDLNSTLAFNVNAQPTVQFVGGFTTPNTFNRDAITGDDVTITGTNFKNVNAIVMVDENNIALPNTPAITLPNPGVTVADNSIIIDTSTAQFLNGSSGDSNATSLYRRFGLTGPRTTIYTAQDQRFYVGVPPKYTSYSGLTSTVHYRRDSNTFTVNGSGLGIISYVEIVDINGNTIAANTSISTDTGVTSVSNAQFTIAANSFPNANLVDATSSSARRMKITTPFGIAVSDNNSSGTFSVSAIPGLLGNVAATFAGGGYDGSNNTYDLSNGNLVINGSNFLGVKTIQLEDNSSNPYITTSVDPAAPPAGISFNWDGTQITITSDYITDNNASWASSSSLETMRVKLTTAADQSTTTPNIVTAKGLVGPIITTLGGTAFASSNFQRSGTLVINGAGLAGVTSVTLVDLNGAEISGVSPITGGSLTIAATSVTVAADAFDLYGKETDTNATAGRRVKIGTASASYISSASTPFTVSSTPDVSAVAATVYAGSTSAATGIHTHSTGTGNISITAVGKDMNGVTLIDFWETAGPGVVAGTTQLKEDDWTVSADGLTITITEATITSKGLNWFTPYSGAANRAFRLTTAAGVQAISTAIQATPFYTFASLTGTGYTAPNFQRNGTFIITANAGEDLSNTTSVTLVDAAGNDFPGATATTVTIPLGPNLTVTANTVTIAADAFDVDGKQTDVITAIRRVKVSRPTGDLISAALFTVSSPPDVSAVASTVYAGTGDGGAAGGTYARATGNGNISITAAALDMAGVKTIEFIRTTGPTFGSPPITLTPADWTVDVAGDTITITGATMTSNGLGWFTPPSAGANRAFRLTTAAGEIANSTTITATP